MSLSFELRANLSEWMDEPCSYEELRACLHDLAQVNRITVGYRPTLRWLEAILKQGQQPVHLVDIGCGGGDLLRQIERWASRKKIALRLTGIDLNPHAARAAREWTGADSNIAWVTGDAFCYKPAVPIDLVISSLFTHHLTDRELVRFLVWMEEVAARGWFVNDLYRERLSYYGFMVFARVMRWHRFVQHDGPVSFRRSFRREDWNMYLAEAHISRADVRMLRVHPGRLCLSRVKR